MQKMLWRQHMNEENNNTELKEEVETMDWSKPDYVFTPKSIHRWRQQGYSLICIGCELEHGVYIGPTKLMVGENEDGTPIFTNRV